MSHQMSKIFQVLLDCINQDDYDNFANSLSQLGDVNTVDAVRFRITMFLFIVWRSLFSFNTFLHICTAKCNYRFLLAVLAKKPDTNLQNVPFPV